VGHRPVKSGSWNEPAELCRATLRRGLHTSTTAENLGFRPLLELEFDPI